MTYTNQGSGFSVRCSRADVEHFRDRWPCSGLPARAITFGFERNGDLVEIYPDSERFDGPALVALSQDAQAFGAARHGSK
jgi:hypothetical protein